MPALRNLPRLCTASHSKIRAYSACEIKASKHFDAFFTTIASARRCAHSLPHHDACPHTCTRPIPAPLARSCALRRGAQRCFVGLRLRTQGHAPVLRCDVQHMHGLGVQRIARQAGAACGVGCQGGGGHGVYSFNGRRLAAPPLRWCAGFTFWRRSGQSCRHRQSALCRLWPSHQRLGQW